MNARLPFSLRRDADTPLTTQIVQGFTEAIRSGLLRNGDRLPTAVDMAAELSVSANVMRNAVRQLTREGLLQARRRCGIEVCLTPKSVWKGHVIHMHWARAASYYHSVRKSTMEQVLLRKKIRVSSVYLGPDELEYDYPTIRLLCDSQTTDAAILCGQFDRGIELCAARGIPILHAFHTPTLPYAQRTCQIDRTGAFRGLLRHSKACGVKSILVVMREEGDPELQAVFATSGMRHTILAVRIPSQERLPADVEAAGYAAFAATLEERPHPDLVYFADDHLLRGGIRAMDERGIRAPEHVLLAAQLNRGSEPAYHTSVSAVMMDPFAHGAALAQFVLDAVRIPGFQHEPTLISAEWRPGGTTERP